MKKRKKSYFYRSLSLWNNFFIIIIFLFYSFFSAWEKDSRCRTCQQSHVAVLLRFRSVSLNLMKCKLIWNTHPCCWWRKPLTKLGNKIYPRYIFTLTLTKMTFTSPPHPYEKGSRLLHLYKRCKNCATVSCRAIPAFRMVQGWIKNRLWLASNQTYLSSS